MLPDKLLLDNGQFFTEVARMLSQGHCVTIRAKGNSMFPFITGDRDTVMLRKAEDVAVGDIVLARLSTGHVLHRVYAVQEEWITLMGDGNLQSTERCRRKDVLGRAVRIIRGDRPVDCTSKAALRKAAVWRRLLPVRRYLLYALRKLSI